MSFWRTGKLEGRDAKIYFSNIFNMFEYFFLTCPSELPLKIKTDLYF